MTTMTDNNGASGNVYKVMTKEQDLQITSFSVNANAGTGQVKVWAKIGEYAGFEDNAGAWTLLQDVSVTSSGEANTLAALPDLDTPYQMSAGSIHSFKVWSELGVGYTNGGAEGSIFPCDQNPGDMDVMEGKGCSNELDCPYVPRVWNGKIEYTLATVGSPNPTNQPTPNPTNVPTSAPTLKPTANPTNAPTTKPTNSPTQNPSKNPTTSPVDLFATYDLDGNGVIDREEFDAMNCV